MRRYWDFLGRQFGGAARAGLLIGAVAIVLATAAVGYFLLRTDYQVLFADLTPQDTMAMTAELDRLKIPYVLSDQGAVEGSSVGTILVDKADVYKTRIRLMGKDVPLHGGVGFELFNSGDLGMTEFAQKINYQRALQGELTRTILSLAEVRDARVLLALPEQGLFKQATAKAKASVTIALKSGQSLRAEQVSGIQRLVSAAVPGIQSRDVTIVDQGGLALTRPSGDDSNAEADAGAGAGGSRLDLKKDTEAYLSHKATSVLEHALGAGEASASVDVTLNMDRVQSSTDEPIGAPGKPGEPPMGLITKELESTRDGGGPLNTAGNAGASGATPGSNRHDVEYALGHHLEQVVSQPGSVRRIQVAVVVRKAVPALQQEQLRQMVAAAVGASFERGDTVVVQSAEGLDIHAADGRTSSPLANGSGPSADEGSGPAPAGRRSSEPSSAHHTKGGTTWSVGRVTAALVAPFALALLIWAFARIAVAPKADSRRSLSVTERREVLAKLQTWLADTSADADDARRPPSSPGTAQREVAG